jgi:uncharacterized protein (TIGR02145 family)
MSLMGNFMRKFLIILFAIILILGCGNNDDLPYMTCGKPGGSQQSGPSVYYEGETYETVEIGCQTWFKRNLNYNIPYSKCYENDSSNCSIYGRLYDWATAMNLDRFRNYAFYLAAAKHKGICPPGWHIPSNGEWDVLVDFVGGYSTAGRYLKATIGWDNNGNGQDNYGFSALPGGYNNYSGDYFYDVGSHGGWWSSSEYNGYEAYGKYIGYEGEYVKNFILDKYNLFSVRCLKD